MSITLSHEHDTTAVADGPASTTRSDEQLLLDYRDRGDSASFAELVQRYERELYNYLRLYLGDGTLADDVFQTTFLQVHLKCDQFKDDLTVRPWLYRIATNQAIDTQRRNRRHRLASLDGQGQHGEAGHAGIGDRLEGIAPAPGDRLEQDEQRKSVRQAVRQLPEPFRQIVTLVYLKGFKYREAADHLSIPLGTLKSRMHKALKMLGELCPAGEVALTS